MPNVRSQSQSPQQGYHTSAQIKKTMKPAYPRDDINQAFAGDENEASFGMTKRVKTSGTHLKSRKTEKSKSRTPKR